METNSESLKKATETGVHCNQVTCVYFVACYSFCWKRNQKFCFA